jgi:hypothetical protein
MVALLARALLALFLGIVTLVHPGTGATNTSGPAAVAPVTAPAAPDSECQVALAYLHVHGNPAFQMRCEPGFLPGGLAAITCWHSSAFGVSCPNGGVVVISKPACAISYENEASNSWIDFSTLTSGALNGRGRHDATGRMVDPFGECG